MGKEKDPGNSLRARTFAWLLKCLFRISLEA